MNLLQFLIKGGPIVGVIMLCSVIAVGVFLERLWSLSRRRVLPDAFVDRIETLIKEHRIKDALLLCQESQNPIANIMAAALRNAKRQRPIVKEAVEEVGKLESAVLERYIEVVGTMASVAPLLGLLGTVLGMLTVFQRIEQNGLGDPSVFASGIWEALITTVVGLAVAIPSLVAYKYLLGRVDHVILEMEERSLRLIDMLAAEEDAP